MAASTDRSLHHSTRDNRFNLEPSRLRGEGAPVGTDEVGKGEGHSWPSALTDRCTTLPAPTL